jgi:hypothetical protein
MVTHSSTSRPVQCLCMAERTGCPVLTDLWSYVLVSLKMGYMNRGVWKGVRVEMYGRLAGRREAKPSRPKINPSDPKIVISRLSCVA